MLPSILLMRMNKELADLERDPPPGIICFPVDDDITHLEAYINGPPDSPYEKGTFRLEIHVPHDYPFNPPQIRFKTMIYHPNIDDAGRICADILKKGDNGGWKPSLNISTTLISLSTLMGSPNPDDPLDAEIAQEYRIDNSRFLSKAKELTLKYATGEQAKEDTTMQQQDSKPGSSSAETLDSLERNANRPKQKSKLSLSIKKRKLKSPSILDSNSTPSSSQMTGEEMDILEVKSDLPSGNTDNAICDDGYPGSLDVKSGPPSANGENVACDDTSVDSVVPVDNGANSVCSNNPVEDTDIVESDTPSDDVKNELCEEKSAGNTDALEMESGGLPSNGVNTACKDIKVVEGKGRFELSASSPSQHIPSTQSILSEISSQKAHPQQSASSKNLNVVETISAGKENMDDTAGSQKSVQNIVQDRTALKLATNVNSKELVEEVKKEKGKFVYKPPLSQTQGSRVASGDPRSTHENSTISDTPSEYTVGCGWRSSLDGFSFQDAIDLTSDNDFIPKKRMVDSTKRNKLSLSKSKRQKSQNSTSST